MYKLDKQYEKRPEVLLSESNGIGLKFCEHLLICFAKSLDNTYIELRLTAQHHLSFFNNTSDMVFL